MGFRDRWPLRRPPDPPGFVPGGPTSLDPAGTEFVAWQRATPIAGWMTVPTDPRIPTPGVATTEPEDPPMTEPATEQRQVPEIPPMNRPRCEHCGATMPTAHDYLRQSIDLIDNAGEGVGDEVVVRFYERLFSLAPDLRLIFPADLLDAERGSDTKGFRQRDQLVSALRAVALWYDPFNPKSMQSLDSALQTMGRRHAAFEKRDGSGVIVPRRAHYDAVDACLMDTLHEVAGEAWLPVWDAAWAEALEHVGDSMRHYARQWRGGFARLTRESAEPVVSRRRAAD
jgi:hemoglobin-like flavoprotein